MFATLLVANRGEIACRIMRTARSMGIRTVAVYSEPDAAADHVRGADVAVALGGHSPADSYLDVAKLIDAATRTGADAVHPGYGFVSESAPAAQAFVDAGLVWVGPAPEVIAALGDKIRAKELMAAAGVPLLPSRSLPAGASAAEWAEAAGEVGYPRLVKAAAGGGGRGMRRVDRPMELAAALEGAVREAAAAFGDGTVFLERCLEAPRHVEVQIVADSQGTVLHLGDRECSIQRRHQKVVEEAPAPGLADPTRAGLRDAAVAGATAVGYVGAGTWEFLVHGDAFAFLEVNTRLQVEHPVTELTTGLDLVRLQLLVAAGSPLPLAQDAVRIWGHAIEARVVAEDPARDWLPSAGPLHRFGPRPGSVREGVRYDLGFSAGAVIAPDYDSLLGKVIAAGTTRAEAAARLRAALAEFEIHGLVTNRDLLVGILGERDFLSGQTSTAYLDEHPDLVDAEGADAVSDLHAVAASLWWQATRRQDAGVLRSAPSGWRNLRSQRQIQEWQCGDATATVEYCVIGTAFDAAIADRRMSGRILRSDADGIDIEADGLRLLCRCQRVGRSVWVGSGSGQTTLVARPRFADGAATSASGRGPTAPVPGTVIGIVGVAGQAVAAGEPLVVLEAMKLEHKIKASADAVVSEVRVSVGDKVDAHQLLVVLEGAP
ncbi:MAG: biotin carboxylase N-terminal domain-containing protein [Acidimicrobiales bacterium]